MAQDTCNGDTYHFVLYLRPQRGGRSLAKMTPPKARPLVTECP
jgi:hypothetical protein